jgi:hypothetical protein
VTSDPPRAPLDYEFMSRHGIFKTTPVSTKSFSVVPSRPDSSAIRGSEAMRDAMRGRYAVKSKTADVVARKSA